MSLFRLILVDTIYKFELLTIWIADLSTDWLSLMIYFLDLAFSVYVGANIFYQYVRIIYTFVDTSIFILI